uniref:Uncharacterized protein n=1 Tax=Lepeophtheirus salmonis TaxID=72036 RepID=A0A0K2V0E0_LEPSM
MTDAYKWRKHKHKLITIHDVDRVSIEDLFPILTLEIDLTSAARYCIKLFCFYQIFDITIL